MWKHIFTQGCYQLFWLFLIIYGADKYIGRYKQPTECSTYSSLDLSYLTVETLSVVAHQTGATFDVCCSGDGCYTASGGIYLTGQPHKRQTISLTVWQPDSPHVLRLELTA